MGSKVGSWLGSVLGLTVLDSMDGETVNVSTVGSSVSICEFSSVFEGASVGPRVECIVGWVVSLPLEPILGLVVTDVTSWPGVGISDLEGLSVACLY